MLSSVKQGEARGAELLLKRRMLSGWGRLVWCGAVSRLILYIILYSYYNVSPSVRTVRSGSVVPAAAEGSNSHLQHTLHTPADASSRTLPAKCRGWSGHITISSIQLGPQPRRSSSKNLGAGRVFGSMEGRRGGGEPGLLAAALSCQRNFVEHSFWKEYLAISYQCFHRRQS